MKTKTLLLTALFFLVMGCSTSRITHSWKSETATVKKYNKIMVLGLVTNTHRGVREKMENHFVGDLAEHGYTAVSSLQAYGPGSFENIKEEEAVSKLHNSSVDAVITIVLLDKKKERYYVPASVNYTTYSMYPRHLWGYYTTVYNRIYSPGYYQVNTKYFWESNMYDAETKELLYSVQTESFDPGSVENLAHEYGKLIVNDMAKKGVIK